MRYLRIEQRTMNLHLNMKKEILTYIQEMIHWIPFARIILYLYKYTTNTEVLVHLYGYE